MKVFGYMRCSSSGQVSGDTWARQEAAILRYAEANGLEVVGWYRDEGVSGTVEDREALAYMLVSLEENGHGVKTVIVEKLDRLSRDLMVQEAIVGNLKKGGFSLISAAEGSDLLSDDPTRKLIRQLFGCLAEWEKSMLVLKLRASRERKRAATGKCEGQKGYIEREPVVIEELRKYRNEGMSFPEIARLFNEASDGPNTLSGCEWTAANLARIWRRAA